MNGAGNRGQYSAAERERGRLDRLYGGEILHVRATATSALAAKQVRDDLAGLLPSETDPRDAEGTLGLAAFTKCLRGYLRSVRTRPEWRTWIPAIVEEAGLPLATLRFDTPNLRVVLARPEDKEYSDAVCFAHRDTWSAHHQAQINWWLAVYDTPWEASMAFFPDLFTHPVPNNSEEVNYAERRFLDLIGRASEAERPSPRASGDFDRSAEKRIPTLAGDLLVFSAAQLHGTRPNTSGRTRFSLDFRTVLADDAERNKGPENVDNRSQGSTLMDMLRVEV